MEGEEVVAGPGTFVLVPPGVVHTFANHGNAAVRMLNIHAPAGFDLRLAADNGLPLPPDTVPASGVVVSVVDEAPRPDQARP